MWFMAASRRPIYYLQAKTLHTSRSWATVASDDCYGGTRASLLYQRRQLNMRGATSTPSSRRRATSWRRRTSTRVAWSCWSCCRASCPSRRVGNLPHSHNSPLMPTTTRKVCWIRRCPTALPGSRPVCQKWRPSASPKNESSAARLGRSVNLYMICGTRCATSGWRPYRGRA